MNRVRILAASIALVAATAAAQERASLHALLEPAAVDTVASDGHASLVADLEAQERAYAAAHGVPAPKAAQAANLAWPLRAREGFAGFDYQAATYFVDHDRRNPGFVQDYACGARTYDVAGYNHGGTDYVLWPFAWRMMDRGDIAVVAAAGGTLVARRDGEFDRNCEFRGSPTTPNAVSIRQDDGLTARYLHFRRGSVTALPIGARVEAGDVLGLVGSSGPSSVPHLHFELNHALGGVVDPRAGACNPEPERWIVAQPYERPRIMMLGTHAAEPAFVDCGVADGVPVHEQAHERRRFARGEALHAFVAFGDHRRGTVATFELRQPDGEVFARWQHDLADEDTPRDFYAGTAWSWEHVLPSDAPAGRWILHADFAGKAYEHAFVVGAGPNPDQQGLSGSWANAATDAQGLLLDLQADFFEPGIGLAFGGWFTWAPAAAPAWYTIQGEVREDAEASTMPIYRTEFGAFDAPDPTTTHAVGSATLRFEDCSRGSLEYAFVDGRSGTIPLTRLLANVRCSRDGDAGDAGADSRDLHSGAWADPANSGQGLLFDLDTVQGVLFAAWYTFAPPNAPRSQRWYTLQAPLPGDLGVPADIAIFETQGGRFDAASSTTTRQVGTARLVFHSCTAATLEYHFDDGRAGTLDLVRIGRAPPACGS